MNRDLRFNFLKKKKAIEQVLNKYKIKMNTQNIQQLQNLKIDVNNKYPEIRNYEKEQLKNAINGVIKTKQQEKTNKENLAKYNAALKSQNSLSGMRNTIKPMLNGLKRNSMGEANKKAAGAAFNAKVAQLLTNSLAAEKTPMSEETLKKAKGYADMVTNTQPLKNAINTRQEELVSGAH